MSEDLIDAIKARKAADDEIVATLRRDYPVGALVAWKRGSRTHAGHVLLHGYGERLKVRNALTDRSYWIAAIDVARATDATL